MNEKQTKFEEVTVRTEPIFQGKIISLQVDHVKLPNGEMATREIIKHPGAVAVIALHNGKMLMVDQFRKPLERCQLEIPAGKLDPNEEPLSAAKRELKEETGFSCETIRHVCSFYTSPGFADELLHLYFAEQVVPGEAQPDEDEFLDCEAVTFEQAQQYMLEGRISDAKTIMAVYLWQIYKLTGQI